MLLKMGLILTECCNNRALRKKLKNMKKMYYLICQNQFHFTDLSAITEFLVLKAVNKQFQGYNRPKEKNAPDLKQKCFIHPNFEFF